MAKGYSLDEIKTILDNEIEEMFSSLVGNEKDGIYCFSFSLTNYNGEQWEKRFNPKEDSEV